MKKYVFLRCFCLVLSVYLRRNLRTFKKGMDEYGFEMLKNDL